MTVAAASAGAGLVHMAFAPDHLSQSATHGAFFLVVAWVQLGVAWALGTGRAPRWLLLGTALFDAAVIGVWLASRTVGVDGAVEQAGFPDAVATGLEVVVVIGAGLLAMGWMGPRIRMGTVHAWAGISAVAAVALVSAAVAPSPAATHSHELAGASVNAGPAHDHGKRSRTSATVGSHDHPADSTVHDHDPSVTVGTTSTGHDHQTSTTPSSSVHQHDATTPPPATDPTGGHNHPLPPPDTSSAWETTRRAALLGGLDPATYSNRLHAMHAYLAAQLFTRSPLLATLPIAEAEARVLFYAEWQLAHMLDAEHGGNHSGGPAAWIPLAPAGASALQGELKTAAAFAARYPTAADAVADHYFQVTPWFPGIGAHYLRVDRLAAFDPGAPSILLYNGNEPTSELVGVSYAVLGATPPAGFTGPNDVWHEHPALCLVGGAFVVGLDSTPADLCALVGGTKGSGFGAGHLWMMHLWQVPGWQSAWGLFSGENPAVNFATTEVGR